MRYPTTVLTALAIALAGGCGGDDPNGPAVATTPAERRSEVRDGRVVARGDYAPARHGPFDLSGRYRVSFTQRGKAVDFAAEVPFTAHLEQAATAGPGKSVVLFEQAAATGAKTINATGRYEVVVDFGDSPYEIELVPDEG